jgi:hypothetical protein
MWGNCKASHGACVGAWFWGDCDTVEGTVAICRSHSSIDWSASYVDRGVSDGSEDATDAIVQSRHVVHPPGLVQDANAFAVSLKLEPLCSLQPGQAQSSPHPHIEGKVPSAGHSS